MRLLRDPLGTVGDRFARYGATYYVHEGGEGHLLVSCDPAVVREVLVEHPTHWQKRGGANDNLVPILGDGLLTADGEAWKQARRKLQPGFRASAIAGYARRMVDEAAAIDWPEGTSVDVSAEMMALTLRIVCACLFDHDIRGSIATVGATMDALHDAVAAPPLPEWLPTPWRRRRRKAVAKIEALLEAMIAQRRAGPAGDDLLSMLLQAGFDDRGVRDQLITLFLAGHETTSHALSWTWWLLAHHPEALDALHREVDALPSPPDATTPLPFTDAVVNEALRLYPPAYALPRVARCDTTVGPYTVSEGTQVVLWLWHAHRDPAAFDDPDAFRPDRFADGTRPPASFLPFGAGTRMCIGAGFARLELRLLLATLARRYRLRAVEGHEVRPMARVTLSPHGGLPMQVERRGGR